MNPDDIQRMEDMMEHVLMGEVQGESRKDLLDQARFIAEEFFGEKVYAWLVESRAETEYQEDKSHDGQTMTTPTKTQYFGVFKASPEMRVKSDG